MVNKLRIIKEATRGTTPASPADKQVFQMAVESFDIKETQQSETNKLLGAGASMAEKAYGQSTFGGSMGALMTLDSAPILASLVFGDLTRIDYTATLTAWASATAVTVGDMKKTGSGTVYTLICTVAGTTGATAPSTAGGRGTTVVDGTATWMIMPTLYKYTGTNAQCTSSITAEISDITSCGGSESTANFFRYRGLHFTKFTLGKTGSTIGLKQSMDGIGMGKDSFIGTNVGTLGATAYTNQVTLDPLQYGAEDLTVKVDGTAISKVESIELNYSRTVDIPVGASTDRVVSFGTAEMTGTLVGEFNTTLYSNALAHTQQAYEFNMAKASYGCYAKFSFNAKPDKVDPMFATEKTTMLSLPLNVSGLVTIEIVSPVAF